MEGTPWNTTLIYFTRDIFFFESPTSVTVIGTFSIVDTVTGTQIASGIAPAFSPATTATKLVLTYTTTGLTAGRTYVLRSENVTSIQLDGV